MNSKNFCKVVLCISGVVCVVVGSLTAYIDPYFHFRGPREGIKYIYGTERYMNDGITRNFNYDAIITGTSMTENFKSSKLDELFNVTSIKVPYSGSTYKEIAGNLDKAFLSGNKIKMVVRSIDFASINMDKDDMAENFIYPEYLLNDNKLDDVNYLLNKDIFLNGTLAAIEATLLSKKETNFDDYAVWTHENGKKVVLQNYIRPNINGQVNELDEENRKTILGNLDQNVTRIVRENPNTQFYLFFPPYSIVYWDTIQRKGLMSWHKDVEELVIKELVGFDNVHLFSFNNFWQLTTNLDNYIDECHYTSDVNDWILEQMYDGNGQLTVSNYKEYLDECYSFYNSYDYDKIFVD